MIKKTRFGSKQSTFLQKTLAAEAHLTQRQCLSEKQTLNLEKYMIREYREGILRPAVFKW
jgi:hypothetical protein